MSSTSKNNIFENAFERLKNGKPELLPIGSKVSQNNVAREAGCTPTALRKERFPQLIKEIQNYVRKEQSMKSVEANRTKNKMRFNSNRTTQEKIDLLEADAASKTLSLLAEICELRSYILKMESKIESAKIIKFNQLGEKMSVK